MLVRPRRRTPVGRSSMKPYIRLSSPHYAYGQEIWAEEQEGEETTIEDDDDKKERPWADDDDEEDEDDEVAG